jgi:hypothetical protein
VIVSAGLNPLCISQYYLEEGKCNDTYVRDRTLAWVTKAEAENPPPEAEGPP